MGSQIYSLMATAQQWKMTTNTRNYFHETYIGTNF